MWRLWLGQSALWLALGILLVLLTGCAGTASRPLCPGLVDYPPDLQDALADELQAAPPGAVWPRFIVDYGALRAGCRAIEKTP